MIGAYNPAVQAPPRPPQSWPPAAAPGSWPPRSPASSPPTPVPARSQPPAPAAQGSVDATTLQPPPVAHPGTPVPGRYEAEATTLQPPPARSHPPTPVPGTFDVEATTLQARPQLGTPLPVARPVPPPGRGDGPLALDPRPADVRPPTLSGHAPTQVPTPAPPLSAPPPARPEPGSRGPRPKMPPPAEPAAARAERPSAGPPMPVLIGGGVLVLVLAIGSYFIFRSKPEPSPTPSAQPSAGSDAALLKQLLDSQALLARKQLEDKDFRAAAKQAQEVLDKDAGHAEAAAVLAAAQKSLQEVEAAVAETRKAMDAGNVKGASEGLTRILALDPKNPAVAEFEPRLNQFFRSQAESARKEMSDSQRQAEHTKQASSQGDFGAAVAVGRDAEALFAKGEFAQATRKFMESRDAYERARRAAERAAKAPPSVTAPPSTTLTAAVTTLAPTTMASVITPEPPTPPPAGHADEAEIRDLVAQYQRALETRDPGLLKTLKPDLSGKEQDALKRSLATSVNITMGPIQLQSPEKAQVMVARTDRLSNGNNVGMQQTLILTKKTGHWTIQQIRSQLLGQ